MEEFHFTASMTANMPKVKSFFEFALANGLFVCVWIQGYGCASLLHLILRAVSRFSH